MKYTEFTGKTVEEAVEKGLQELGLTAEQADVRVLEEGKKIGIEQFFLEVRAGNKPAISLYEKCGFQVEGVRKNLYEMPKEDGLIMWKR